MAAIAGLDHAYYERFPDLLSALRSLAAGAKTGELILGYNAPSLHFSSSREREVVLPTPTQSPLHDRSRTSTIGQSASQTPTQRRPASAMNSTRLPNPASLRSPSLSSSNPPTPNTWAPPAIAPHPPLYIGPMPTVPRSVRVSVRNRVYCYVVVVGRRPGIYYTWCVLFFLSFYVWLSDCVFTGRRLRVRLKLFPVVSKKAAPLWKRPSNITIISVGLGR